MHPRVRARREDQLAFFERNLHWHVPFDLTWVALSSEGEVIGTATLEPPPIARPLADTISHWLWPTLRAQGMHTVTRITRAAQQFTALSTRFAGSPSYFHVHAVAVAPDWQRKGVGLAVMGELMSSLQALNTQAAPVVLSTQRQHNVAFYQRFGFVLCGRERMGQGLTSRGFDSWFMKLGPNLAG